MIPRHWGPSAPSAPLARPGPREVFGVRHVRDFMRRFGLEDDSKRLGLLIPCAEISDCRVCELRSNYAQIMAILIAALRGCMTI
jgi:hypothetical protein